MTCRPGAGAGAVWGQRPLPAHDSDPKPITGFAQFCTYLRFSTINLFFFFKKKNLLKREQYHMTFLLLSPEPLRRWSTSVHHFRVGRELAGPLGPCVCRARADPPEWQGLLPPIHNMDRDEPVSGGRDQLLRKVIPWPPVLFLQGLNLVLQWERIQVNQNQRYFITSNYASPGSCCLTFFFFKN